MPETFTSLRFAHGSCRKWPGDTRRYERGLGKEDTGKYKCKTDGDDTGTDDNDLGPDMLDQFGHKWLAPQWNAQLKKYQAKNWSDWPRFFLHTGDQIYADDIGINTSKMLLRNRFAAVVPGPGRPSAVEITGGAWAGRFAFRYSEREKLKRPTGPDDLDDLMKIQPRIKQISSRDIDRDLRNACSARQQATFSQDEEFEEAKGRTGRFKYRVMNKLLWEIPDDKVKSR